MFSACASRAWPGHWGWPRTAAVSSTTCRSPRCTPHWAAAGGQNVHVAVLALGLARLGHLVTVYTRRTCPGQAPAVRLGPGVTVRRLTAGPEAPLPKDELLPHMAELGERLRREWRRCPPDVVHAHYWMS